MSNCQPCIEGMNALLAAMQERVNCALKSAESPATDRQQLKAEIAALVNRLESYSLSHEVDNEFWDIIERMRQLSAV
jgi:hypothetical protein